jgi:electron transfer flavoprotein alpha/beta subunit
MEITDDDKVTVVEEVDGGVQTVSARLPMIVTTDLRSYSLLRPKLMTDLMNLGMRRYRIS